MHMTLTALLTAATQPQGAAAAAEIARRGILYEKIAVVCFAAAVAIWLISILIWFSLHLPEEISEMWKIFRA